LQAITIKQLRQFLEMSNFYKRFIPGAAEEQAILNDMLKAPNTRARRELIGQKRKKHSRNAKAVSNE